MTSVIRDLPDAWEAETCDRFVEQYFDAEPKLKDVKGYLTDSPVLRLSCPQS